jgi:hypothetical protein
MQNMMLQPSKTVILLAKFKFMKKHWNAMKYQCRKNDTVRKENWKHIKWYGIHVFSKE